MEGSMEQIGDLIAYNQYREAAVGKIVQRGELIEPANFVNLTIQFKDSFGCPVNTDVFPSVSIVSPTGLVVLAPTCQGVGQIDIGKYNYIFQAPIAGPFGVYNDRWDGIINGFLIQQTFSFVVSHTDQPSINSDGFLHLGDDPGYTYDQAAIFNINKVLKMVKARLNSSGKAKSTDKHGNVTYVDCDIYSVDMLVTFIAMSLNKFNSTPYFTNFVFQDSHFFAQFAQIIADGAVLYALASQSLIEKGREFTLTDNGISFTPPQVSELLNTQYAAVLAHHWEELKYVKNSMRPHPLGLGTWGMTSSINPAIKRLSHLRARRIV
jgi:hypothetical protein